MFKHTHITTRQLADGSILTIPVFTFPGTHPQAPQTYIQSSIHGAEIQGNGVILHLIDHFSKHPPLGTIVLVPNVNPFSINQRLGDYGYSRFDPNTGDNWNRLYANITCPTPSEKTADDQIVIEEFLKKIATNAPIPEVIKKLQTEILDRLQKRLENHQSSYGQKLALQIQAMASKADIVLDLHCDTISLPHLYSPNYAIHSAREFNIPYLISIPEKFAGALDEACFCPWSHLAQVWKHPQYTQPHVEAFTLEFGSQEVLDLDAAKEQASSIIHYLSTKHVCHDTDYKRISKQYVCPLADLGNIYSPQGGYISYFAPLGEIIQTNQPLLKILQINDLNNPNIFENAHQNPSLFENLTTTVPAPVPCIPIVRSCSATVHEGLPVMKIFKSYSIIEN